MRNIVLLIGPAGVGKDTIMRLLVERAGFRIYPSLTTRPMRPGETQGNPYTFVSDAEYDALQATGDFLNDIVVGGYRYGYQRSALEDAMARGERLVFPIVYEWAMRFKASYPGMTTVLLKAPSREEQIRRLHARGATEEEIARRMADAHVQEPPEDGVDLVLVNETGAQDATAQRILDFLT